MKKDVKLSIVTRCRGRREEEIKKKKLGCDKQAGRVALGWEISRRLVLRCSGLGAGAGTGLSQKGLMRWRKWVAAASRHSAQGSWKGNDRGPGCWELVIRQQPANGFKHPQTKRNQKSRAC